jgi:hypothetical protein
MKTLHAKSPCCQERVIRFGNRRRQCVVCKNTWRIRKKKRGRKQRRITQKFVEQYLDKKVPPLYKLAQNKRYSSRHHLQRKLKKSLVAFLNKSPWPTINSDHQVITVADAMMIKMQKDIYTFYFILLRPVHSNKAVITKPFLEKGKESWIGWHKAFMSLEQAIIEQIWALVSDGHQGLISVAKLNHWLIQRCNFHIIAKIQGRRSRWVRSRNRKEGEKLYGLLNDVLTSKDNKRAARSLKELASMIYKTKSAQLKRYLSGFIRNHEEYRTYLKYPFLNLPRTSNSAEVVIRMVRTLCSRAHGFRTINSLSLWINAIIKHKKFVICNGSHQPN